MKKPFYFATAAAGYVVVIVFLIQLFSKIVPEDTIITPMVVLGLFVLSTAVMGFLFLSEPVRIFMEGNKHSALMYFGKIVGVFALYVLFFVLMLLLVH